VERAIKVEHLSTREKKILAEVAAPELNEHEVNKCLQNASANLEVLVIFACLSAHFPDDAWSQLFQDILDQVWRHLRLLTLSRISEQRTIIC
jgi:hypothetical protein